MSEIPPIVKHYDHFFIIPNLSLYFDHLNNKCVTALFYIADFSPYDAKGRETLP